MRGGKSESESDSDRRVMKRGGPVRMQEGFRQDQQGIPKSYRIILFKS
jgi:hypothetical protein